MPRATCRMIPLLAMVALSVCLAEQAQAQVELRWKFEPGEKLLLSFEQTKKVTTTIDGKEYPATAVSEIDMQITVKDVNAQGEVALRVETIRYKSVLDTPGGRLVFDSEAEDPPEDDPNAAAVSQVLDYAMKLAYETELHPLGMLRDLKLDPVALKAAEELAGGQANYGNPLGVMQLLKEIIHFWIQLPEQPVEQGDTWGQAYDFQSKTGVVRNVATYRYEGNEVKDDMPLEKLTLSVELEPVEAYKETSPGGELEAVSNQADYVIYFDSKAGRIREMRESKRGTTRMQTPNGDAVWMRDEAESRFYFQPLSESSTTADQR